MTLKPSLPSSADQLPWTFSKLDDLMESAGIDVLLQPLW